MKLFDSEIPLKASFFQRVTMVAAATSLLFAFTACGKKDLLGNCIASQNLETLGQQVGIGNSNAPFGGNTLKQTFTASSDSSISAVNVRLGLNGPIANANNQTITAEIYDQNDAILYTTGSIAVSAITGATTKFYSINVASYDLSASKIYSLHLRPSYPADLSNFVTWARAADGTDHYSGGQAFYQLVTLAFTNAAWGALSDFVFQIGSGC